MKIELPKRIKDKSFFSESWQITWNQVCHGKNFRNNTETRLTLLVFWPLFLVVFLFIAAQLFSYTPPVHPLVVILLEEEQSPFLIGYSVILGVVIGPVLEEIFFRGFCYPIFKSKWGKWPGMILTSLFFALIHDNQFALLPIFALGMALVYVYEKRRSLVAPIVLHLTHNGFLMLYFFITKQMFAPRGM